MKTILRYGLRVLSVVLFAALVCGVLTASGAVRWDASAPDAVSSATAQTVSADDMQGNYVVLLNKALHKDTAADWTQFFSFSENTPLIMEDIVCKTADADTQGLDIARKYQARLPENQMQIRQEPGVMLLSKAELGRFDVVILSEAAARTYSAQTLYNRDDVLVMTM